MYADPMSNRYSNLSSATNNDLHIARPMHTLPSLPNSPPLQHSTQMTTPCSLSDSETMVLSFLPLPKLLFQLLSQHFLFHLTTKCWGSSGLMPRSSSLFPILHLIESQDFKSHDLHLQTPSTYLSSIFLF